MKMIGFGLHSTIIIFFLFLQGCASALILNESKITADIQNTNAVSCATDKRKMIWNQTVMGQLYSKDSNSKLSQYEQVENTSISDQLGKLMHEPCQASTNLIVEVSNTPINESRGLILLNIISLGIIPYWDQFENKIKIETFKEGEQINTYISTVPYTRVQSIFLWLAAPFIVTSEHELNLKTIPMHFNNISEEIQKSSLPRRN